MKKTLDELRERLQVLNHAEVARHANMTRSYVSYIARGERIPTKQDTVEKLHRAILIVEGAIRV